MTKDKKKKKKMLLIPKWKVFRAKEPLISVFMWGVNHIVREFSCISAPVLLLPNDFKAYSKIKVQNHLFNEACMPSSYKIKGYCPNVFRKIRELFGIDEMEYMSSLTGKEPEAETNEPQSSHLFVSYDKKFVIKVVDSEAVAEIHSILRPYHEYLVEMNGKTLLPQYLGLYRVTVDVTETYLLVMRNIFGGRYKIHRKYDLKGSTVQRQASEKERSKDPPMLKDKDFLSDEKYKLIVSAQAKDQLLGMLKNDTEFLVKLHLMDYSLLVGIHDIEMESQEHRMNEVDTAGLHAQNLSDIDSGGDGDEVTQPRSPDAPLPVNAFIEHFPFAGLDLDEEYYALPSNKEYPLKLVYFIGLVDILTYYGVKKRTATAAKTVKYGSEAENISTVRPEQYARRLLEFLNKNVQAVAPTIVPPGPALSSSP